MDAGTEKKPKSVPLKNSKRRYQSKRKDPNRTTAEEESFKYAPHTFVIKRGKLGNVAKELVMDIRKVLEPFTAVHMKENKSNRIKDFTSLAGIFHVTHMLLLSQSERYLNLRIGRHARGPTMTFHVDNFCTQKEVSAFVKRSISLSGLYINPPLLVLNNFDGSNHHKLFATLLQNMLPSINVRTVKLSQVKRCILVEYNSVDNLFNFRHYGIKVLPMGINRSVKKVALKNKIPDLGAVADVADYVLGGNASESEGEMDDPSVTLPQSLGLGNVAASRSAIRLVELGPRMDLRLLKIEEGLFGGKVVYHDYITKSSEEVREQIDKLEEKERVKDERKKRQRANVEKKKQTKEVHNKKCGKPDSTPTEEISGSPTGEDDTSDSGKRPIKTVKKRRVKFSTETNDKPLDSKSGKFRGKRMAKNDKPLEGRKRKRSRFC